MSRRKDSPVSWVRRLSGLLEFIITCVEDAGGTMWDLLDFLKVPENCENLGKLVMGKLKIVRDIINPNDDVITLDIGDRIYEVLKFLKSGETSISSSTMVERAKEMNTHLGEEDAKYIMKHQGDIPVELRGNIYFLFLGWRHSDNPDCVAFLYWDGDEWCQGWHSVDSDWFGGGRLVRRK